MYFFWSVERDSFGFYTSVRIIYIHHSRASNRSSCIFNQNFNIVICSYEKVKNTVGSYNVFFGTYFDISFMIRFVIGTT